MEPRLWERGDFLPLGPANCYNLLQWGRAFGDAEMMQGRINSGGNVALQRGRAPKDAETYTFGALTQPVPELQWGRAPKDTETDGYRNPRPVSLLASIGPRPVGRGDAPRRCSCGVCPSRFNGAAPRRTRKRSVSLQTTRHPAYFNGAAPLGTRIRYDGGCVHCCVRRLQWGRAFGDADTGRTVGGPLRGRGCFNGAALQETRRSWAGGHDSHRLGLQDASIGGRTRHPDFREAY